MAPTNQVINNQPTTRSYRTVLHQEPLGFAGAVTGLLRISLGSIFLWAFLDKTFGLGYSTPAARAWINGGSPTAGFLSNSKGWFASTFQAMAGSGLVEWLFMLGLLGVGLAMMLGIGMRVAAVSGTAMMLLMWLAVMPITSNPFLDSHLIYALVLLMLAAVGAGQKLGFGAAWSQSRLVRRYPLLE